MNLSNLFKALSAIFLTTATVQATTTLKYCSEGSPEGFDPGQYTAATTNDAAAEPIFDRLVEFERGVTQVIPGLAQKWDISPDSLSYTFHLRRGVQFHRNEIFTPTRDLNADDVVFTFTRMLDRDHPFRKAYPSEFPYFVDLGLESNIAKIEKVDTYTVRFTLKKVDAPFLQDLAMGFASIQSAEYADALLKQGKPTVINTNPIGSGPFIFKSYQKDAAIRYTANRAYWLKDDAKVDNLIFVITPDSAVRGQKLKAGECDVAFPPKPADAEMLKQAEKVTIMQKPGFNVGYLTYNITHKPLDNLGVRRALDMAINKKAILETVYAGAGVAATNPMPPTQWSYNNKLKDAPYDPAQAKALLAKAGFTNGFDINLWAMPVQRAYNPNAKQMAEMIQADWAKIGVKASIVSYEWGEYLKRAKRGEHDAALVGWNGDNGDPDNWLGVNLGCAAIGGNNYSQWCNPQFDDLINRGKQTTDVKKRTEIYLKAQEIFKQELPWTTLAHSVVSIPMSKRVQGYKISPFGRMSFSGVSLK
ncbi:ABC transporter substrate-binding protein [Chitinimonas sp. PSY-7]|uniref:ABC transporter substrate-binding protein n=1 Tax=Chitinimonas sp. PSY-7 TaxID=3459088 RepID=UPI00403FCA0F